MLTRRRCIRVRPRARACIPLQIAITMAMLYDLLGPSCFVGLAVLILIVPVQSCLATRISKYTKDTYRFTDERIKLVNEAVQGIRILKFFAFEQKFIDRIAAARNEELYHKRKSLIVNAVNVAILNIGPLLVALLTFLTFGCVPPPLIPMHGGG
ncbi:hypothetical protein EON67_00210 [archaeon]|nr:MAG: hypothetical protein EON67_00210 [archaeon]